MRITVVGLVLALGAMSSSFAQKGVPSPSFVEESPNTVYARPDQIRVHRIDLRGDFQPADIANPYVYVQSMFLRWADDGTAGLSYFSFSGGRTIGDDVVVLGGLPDPGTGGYDTITPQACITELTFYLLSVDAGGGNLALNINFHPWNGLFSTAAGASIRIHSVSLTIPAVNGFGIFEVTVPISPALPVPKAFWIAFTPNATGTTINLANIGLLIGNSTPGNTSLLPGRGYFRATSPTTPVFTSVTGGSVFTGLPQGSFALSLRGSHNFVGQVELSALANRAKPGRPLYFEFDADNDGIEEALRRNLVDVEVTNDSGTPFTSRFTTYLDENGRFTIPVSSAVSQIKVRRWDNGLVAAYARPSTGWSADPCGPTVASATMTFGDVTGDGTIDDNDLLAVLFGFGSSE